LWRALLAVAPGPGAKVDARRLGNYLAKYERRTEAGLRIERVGERQGSALWRVISVDQGPAPSDDDGAPPVGLVGIVGLSQPVQGESAPPYDSAEPAGKNARENRSDPGPSAKVPRKPHNPRPPGDDSHSEAVKARPDHGRGNGRSSRPCGACRAVKWWRRRPAGQWVCGTCHPPAPAPSEIEWAS
jgi:hypothetical protein